MSSLVCKRVAAATLLVCAEGSFVPTMDDEVGLDRTVTISIRSAALSGKITSGTHIRCLRVNEFYCGRTYRASTPAYSSIECGGRPRDHKRER